MIKKYEIKDYIKMINNTSNEFLDDLTIYNHCGKCKNDLNIYYCKIYHENICDNCHEKCMIKKHYFINLDKKRKDSK